MILAACKSKEKDTHCTKPNMKYMVEHEINKEYCRNRSVRKMPECVSNKGIGLTFSLVITYSLLYLNSNMDRSSQST